MEELRDIVESLLDDDGSCRDVNFENPTWKGVEDLITDLEHSYTHASKQIVAADHPECTPVTIESVKFRDDRSFLMELEGGAGPIRSLSLFVARETDGTPFVELTFFPDEIEQSDDLRREFIEWAERMCVRLQATRLYARYGGVSWKLGDIGKESGVFLISDEHQNRT